MHSLPSCSNNPTVGQQLLVTISRFVSTEVVVVCKWWQIIYTIIKITRMWANAQRDDRRAEYRWRPLFNAAKFGWRPILECCAVTLPRRETRWNLQGCPKLSDRSQPLVGWSSPYCENMWRRYCSLTSFPNVDTCLSCKDIARVPDKVVRWCPDGDFLTTFCVLYLQRTRCSTFQTCILNSH